MCIVILTFMILAFLCILNSYFHVNVLLNTVKPAYSFILNDLHISFRQISV
jgi:hypothetical protein